MNLRLTFCICGYYIDLFMFCLCFDFPFSLFSYPFVGVCTVDTDVYGDCTGKNAISHTYTDNGIYYIIVAGVIEDITDFETNGIVVWNRL